MRRIFGIPARLSVVIAIFIAMAGSGFAHRVALQQVDDSLLAYVAAGGTLSDFCGDAEFGSGPQTCDACRLVDGAAMPPALASRLTAFDFSAFHATCISRVAALTSGYDPSRPVRAPPIV